MKNTRHISRLVKLLFEIDNFPAMDRYFSKLLGREIRYSWKIFRHIAMFAQEGKYWEWDNSDQIAYYDEKHVPRFSIFCTCMLHECAHGLCYFLGKPNRTGWYPNKVHEEEVCHKVSEMVCKRIGVEFAKELAELAHEIHKTKDIQKVWELVSKLPSYISIPPDLIKPS